MKSAPPRNLEALDAGWDLDEDSNDDDVDSGWDFDAGDDASAVDGTPQPGRARGPRRPRTRGTSTPEKRAARKARKEHERAAKKAAAQTANRAALKAAERAAEKARARAEERAAREAEAAKAARAQKRSRRAHEGDDDAPIETAPKKPPKRIKEARLPAREATADRGQLTQLGKATLLVVGLVAAGLLIWVGSR